MALQLSATDIHLTSNVTNFPDRLSPISITCWLNYASWGGVDTASLVGVYLSGTTAVQIGNKAGSTGVDVWTWGGTNVISSSGIQAAPVSSWFHVGYSWDGTTNRLYFDGNLVTTSTTTSIAGVLNEVYINGYPTGGINETAVFLTDDVAYFDRALTDEEMKTIAELRGSRDGIYYSALAAYHFNELSPGDGFVPCVDYSGNGNVLAASGAGTNPVYAVGYADCDLRPVLG